MIGSALPSIKEYFRPVKEGDYNANDVFIRKAEYPALGSDEGFVLMAAFQCVFY